LVFPSVVEELRNGEFGPERKSGELAVVHYSTQRDRRRLSNIAIPSDTKMSFNGGKINYMYYYVYLLILSKDFSLKKFFH
jgi:hypothetical protein